jgi:hypothetical protein
MKMKRSKKAFRSLLAEIAAMSLDSAVEVAIERGFVEAGLREDVVEESNKKKKDKPILFYPVDRDAHGRREFSGTQFDSLNELTNYQYHAQFRDAFVVSNDGVNSISGDGTVKKVSPVSSVLDVCVYVLGGVAGVMPLPKGVRVIVKDYDTEGVDTDELQSDEFGNYRTEVHEA